jgi:hypothetical protein
VNARRASRTTAVTVVPSAAAWASAAAHSSSGTRTARNGVSATEHLRRADGGQVHALREQRPRNADLAGPVLADPGHVDLGADLEELAVRAELRHRVGASYPHRPGGETDQGHRARVGAGAIGVELDLDIADGGGELDLSCGGVHTPNVYTAHGRSPAQ